MRALQVFTRPRQHQTPYRGTFNKRDGHPPRPARASFLPLITAFCFACAAAAPAVGRAAATQSLDDELKRGDYQNAIETAERQLAADRTNPAAQRVLLSALLETGRYEEAETRVKKFLAAQPAGDDLRLVLGEVYALTGRYTEAIEAFAKVSNPKGRPEAQDGTARLAALRSDLRSGELLELIGLEEQAREIFRSCVSYYTGKRPRTAPELTVVARALVHLERYQDANDLYREAIAADPSYVEAHLGGGELFTSKYNYAEAADFFRDALKINPHSARAYLDIAANKRLEGGEEMSRALHRALEINPHLVEAITMQAAADLEAEQYDRAAKSLDRALSINPRALEARAHRAALFYLQDRANDYGAEVKAVLAINPHYGALYNTLAHFAMITRRYHQAVEFGRRATELSPHLWDAHLNLGTGLLRTGREAEGRAEVETAFQGDPFNVWAKNTLDLLDAMRDYRETQYGPFLIKAAAKESDALVSYAGELLDEAGRKLSAKYHFTPQGPIKVELFPNHEDFAVRALGLPGLGALGVCFGQLIALDSPSARPAGQFNWGSTLWHEYTHVVTLQMTRYRIPRWLSEGLSVYEERRAQPGWGDDWSPAHLKALAEGRWFGIADLNGAFTRPRTPDDISLAYFQSSQICEFITERYGFEAVLAMLGGYRDNKRTPEVLAGALKLSEKEFDRAFGEYIRAKAGPYLRALEGGWNDPTPAAISKDALLALVQARPDDFVLRLRLGTLYHTEKDLDQAVPHLRRAAELFPYYSGTDNPYEQLARIYETRGDKAAAADILEALIKRDEKNQEALKHLAELRLAQGDQTHALEALRLSFFINPFDHATHTLAGNLYLERNENDRALREYSVALALNPPNLAEANYNVARAYLAAGRAMEAKRAVLRALEAAPNYDKAQDLLLKLVDNSDQR